MEDNDEVQPEPEESLSSRDLISSGVTHSESSTVSERPETLSENPQSWAATKLSDISIVEQSEINADHKSMTIILLGSSGVGKTSFVRYLEYRTPVEAGHVGVAATIGFDLTTIGAKIRDLSYLVKLMDTAGMERHHSFTHGYYRAADGVILVYDLTNYDSFKDVTTWKMQAEENCRPDIPFVLVGNKSDLGDDDDHHIGGENLANDLEIMGGFYKTSSRTGQGIEEAAKSIISLIIENRYRVCEGRLTAVEKIQVHSYTSHRHKNMCVC